MNWKRRGEQIVIIFFFITLLAAAGVIAYLLSLNPNQFLGEKDLLRRIEVLVAGLALIANIGLTGGLIYIYLNQNRVLREEMSVLKNQQELMQKEQQPVIDGPYDVQAFGKNSQRDSSVDEGSGHQFHFSDIGLIPDGLKIKASIETEEDSVSIDTGKKSEDKAFDPPENGIRFRLSNSGGGPAKKFRLWTHLIVHDGPHEGMWARSSLKRLDRYSLHKYADNIIQSGEQDVAFQGPVILKIRDPPREGEKTGAFDTFSFSEGIQKMVREGTTEIEVVLELRYEDTFEQKYNNQFFPHQAAISRDMDWCDFV
jgi:hypothetical protein